MLKPEQVPDTCEWHAVATLCVEGATWKDAIAAVINAWPGMKYTGPTGGGLSQEPLQAPLIILPLPQESRDDALSTKTDTPTS